MYLMKEGKLVKIIYHLRDQVLKQITGIKELKNIKFQKIN